MECHKVFFAAADTSLEMFWFRKPLRGIDMFGWVKSYLVLLVAFLAVSCMQEKKTHVGGGDAEEASKLLNSGDAALRVAIYYVGDAKCKAQLKAKHDKAHIDKVILANNNPKYMQTGKNTHQLDGDNAELISKEFIANQVKQQDMLFGGDKFLQDNNIPRTIADIEDNCRRLLLSVDAEAPPHINSANLYHTSGNFNPFTEAADKFWPARFAEDFGDIGGQITCGSGTEEELNSLCSFAQINDGKRYFAYLWPKRGENSLSAEVTYTRQGKERKETLTIENITLEKQITADTKLSDIVVEADCGEDNGCLFTVSSDEFELECKVSGGNCGEGFAFEVLTVKDADGGGCEIEEGKCKKTVGETRDRVCAGTATVAELSQNETNLSCSFLKDGKQKHITEPPLQISAQHLKGRLCVVTHTKEGKTKIFVDNLKIKEDACGKVGKVGDDEYRLELSFSLAE